MKLDEVDTETKSCPECGIELEPRSVWMTRRYPGTIVLPGWLSAFGWPLVVVLCGVLITTFSWILFGWIPLKPVAIIFGLGLVWAMVKLVSDGEY
ncbi:MAG: hypothetical protein AAGH88_14155 [Planctomycetota bacterium]